MLTAAWRLLTVTSPSAAGGGYSEGAVGAAVEKIEETCEAPEDFSGTASVWVVGFFMMFTFDK